MRGILPYKGRPCSADRSTVPALPPTRNADVGRPGPGSARPGASATSENHPGSPQYGAVITGPCREPSDLKAYQGPAIPSWTAGRQNHPPAIRTGERSFGFLRLSQKHRSKNRCLQGTRRSLDSIPRPFTLRAPSRRPGVQEANCVGCPLREPAFPSSLG